MNFQHTEDRRMLADSLNRFLSEKNSIESRHKSAGGTFGYSKEVYASLAELGTIGALFPEDAGGFGGTGFDVSVVFECLGRNLAVEPLLGALVVGQALIAAGTDAQRAQLEAIVAGSTVAALAHDEPGSHYELTHVATTAVKAAIQTASGNADGWVLNGSKAVVPMGDSADLLLVSARTSGKRTMPTASACSWCRARGGACPSGAMAASTVAARQNSPSPTWPWVQMRCWAPRARAWPCWSASAATRCWRWPPKAWAPWTWPKTRRWSTCAPASSLACPLAASRRCNTAWLTCCWRWSRPARRSSTPLRPLTKATSLPTASTVREKALSAAKVSVGRIGTLVAEESIQMHGGIGMTWELPLSHYAKRLVMIDHQFGDEDHHLARFIALGQAVYVETAEA
jgi:alkylation response protein AidB-like acyl-CoA dehydrogenase